MRWLDAKPAMRRQRLSLAKGICGTFIDNDKIAVQN